MGNKDKLVVQNNNAKAQKDATRYANIYEDTMAKGSSIKKEVAAVGSEQLPFHHKQRLWQMCVNYKKLNKVMIQNK